MLRFRWNYVPLLSEDFEKAPVLHIFPSSTFVGARPKIMVRNLSCNQLCRKQQQRNFELMKSSRKDTACDANEYFIEENITFKRKLPHDATLNVDAYVHTYNTKGELCLSEAGCCSLYVKQIVELSEKEKNVIIVRKKMQVFNVTDVKLVKGVFLFKFFVGDLKNFAQKYFVSQPSPYDFMGAENKQLYVQTFRNYVTANYAVFASSGTRPTWPFMRNIHSHFYAFRGLVVPGLAFVLLDGTNNSVAYYQNLLSLALRRYYKYVPLESDRKEMFEKADEQETAKIMVLMCTAFSNYCRYMTDKVHTVASKYQAYEKAAEKLEFLAEKEENHESHFAAHEILQKMPEHVDQQQATHCNNLRYVKLIESFSVWMRMTKTGDCEDMALEILRHLWDLSKLDFSSCSHLQKIQQVRKKYVPLQTLKGVTSAAITDFTKAKNQIGAHMDITLVPRYYMSKLMQNFNSASPLFENDTENLTGTENNLSVLVCEGTGTLFPDSTPDESMGAKMYLMQSSNGLFSELKTMLHQPLTDNSSFYKTIQSALVHEYIAHGYGIGEVVFFEKEKEKEQLVKESVIEVPDFSNSDNLLDVASKIEQHSHGAVKNFSQTAATYSIRHSDLIDMRLEKTAVYTMPDLSYEEVLRMKRVLAHNHPCISLDSASNNLSEECSKLLESVASMYDNTPQKENYVCVDFYAQTMQITEQFVQKLKHHLRSKKHVFKFEYHSELLCDNFAEKTPFGGVLLRFYSTPLRAIPM